MRVQPTALTHGTSNTIYKFSNDSTGRYTMESILNWLHHHLQRGGVTAQDWKKLSRVANSARCIMGNTFPASRTSSKSAASKRWRRGGNLQGGVSSPDHPFIMQRGITIARRLFSVQNRLPVAAGRCFRFAGGPRWTHRDSGTPQNEYSPYKLQGRIPSMFDKKCLLWTGRFKREEDIPEMVSIEMLLATRNKIRVQICYLMIAMSIVACVVMVASGKKAFREHDSLTKWNLEKKAKLKEQYLQEHGIVTEKTQ